MATESSFPVIETERLRLRAHRPDDLADCARLWADPLVTRYIGGKPFSEEEVWARMLRYAGHWAWLGYGYWVVEEKTSGYYVGEVGFADYRRDLVPPLQGVPEAGWAIATAMSGKGYATESIRAAIHWLEDRLKPERTVCLIAPDNLLSIRVAGKCQYHELRRTMYRGSPTILFGRQAAGSAF